jgi:DNA invertase Pin-like site-specific DNA recombinase
MNDDNQKNNKIRCAIYACSATKNASAISRRIANCKQIAHEHGWETDARDIFQDDGSSGLSTAGRPALSQLLAAIKERSHPIDFLLINDASRLGLDLQSLVKILETLKAYGVSVFIAEIKANLSNSTRKQLLERVMGLFERAGRTRSTTKKVVKSKRENRERCRY